MYSLAAILGPDVLSVAVFGGGASVLDEMEANVHQRRDMILLAGIGRATDAVLNALSGHSAADARITAIARSGMATPFDIDKDPAEFRRLLTRLLFGQEERQ